MPNGTLSGWTVKKELSIGTVVTIVVQSIAIVWFLSAMDNRITNNTERQTEFANAATSRMSAMEASIVALQAALQQEVRNIQADRSDINGRLVRIETLLTQMLETQRRTDP